MPRVLVVEDDPAMAMGLRDNLQFEGHQEQIAADGEEVAWNTVRLKLQEIIDGEDKRNPLSDDKLVEELAKQGITVARRTVTKYRKAMKIPASRQRRAWTS